MLHEGARTVHLPGVVLQLRQHGSRSGRAALGQRASLRHGDGGRGSRGWGTAHELRVAAGELPHLGRGAEGLAGHAAGRALHLGQLGGLHAGHGTTLSTHLGCTPTTKSAWKKMRASEEKQTHFIRNVYSGHYATLSTPTTKSAWKNESLRRKTTTTFYQKCIQWP